MITNAEQDLAAPVREISEIVLQIREFDPEKELERHTIELRVALFRRFGSYSKWPQQLRSSLEKSELSNVLIFLGDLFSFEDEHERVAEFYTRAIDSARASSAQKICALATIRLATALERSFKGEQALPILLDLSRSLSDHDELMEEYWWAKYQLGICLKGLRRFQDASRAFREVTTDAEPHDRHKMLALYQIGRINAELGNDKEAEQTFLACKEKMQENLWGHRRAYALRGLGLIYLDQDRLEEARVELNEALQIAERFLDIRYRNKVSDAMQRLVISLLEDGKQERLSVGQLAQQYALDDAHIHAVFFQLKSKGQRYIEIIDPETGLATDEVVKHDAAHKHGYWHAVVHVILIAIFDMKIYVLLRRRDFEPSKGRWDLSATGHRDVKESDFDAALRKTKDELGLVLDHSRVVRLWKFGEFRKTGGPDERGDCHENIRHFRYKTEIFNREISSVFFYLVNDVEGQELIKSGRASLNWIQLSEACSEAKVKPERFASCFRQINHSRLITWMTEDVRKHQDRQ